MTCITLAKYCCDSMPLETGLVRYTSRSRDRNDTVTVFVQVVVSYFTQLQQQVMRLQKDIARTHLVTDSKPYNHDLDKLQNTLLFLLKFRYNLMHAWTVHTRLSSPARARA